MNLVQGSRLDNCSLDAPNSYGICPCGDSHLNGDLLILSILDPIGLFVLSVIFLTTCWVHTGHGFNKD